MGYTLLNKGLLGTKLGMTQIYEDSGDVVPCTLVEAGPCTVTQVKKADGRDGYEAVQIGLGDRRETLVTKPMRGHFKAAKVSAKHHLREVRMAPGAAGSAKLGDTVSCTIFSVGDYVDVIGTMKGRGFTGVVKRHGFATMKESHGAHYFWRHAGSIGCRKPEHTRSGTRMAGHLGASRSTCQNLKVVRVDAEKNLLYIRGAIAGPNGGLVLVRIAKKRKAAPPAKAAPAA
jgi:large subunit ribosomal protein L3